MNKESVGLLACLVTVICWTVGTFSFTRAARLYAPAAVNRVRLLFALVILTLLACVVLWVSPIHLFTLAHPEQFCWFGLSGIIGFTFGDHFSFTSFRILGSRRATVLVSIAPAASLVSGIYLLDEHLSWIGFIGMSVSIGGLLLLMLSREEQKDVVEEGYGSFKIGILYGLAGAVCQGIGLVLSKKGFTSAYPVEIHPLYATWLRLITATCSGFIITSFKSNPMKEVVHVLKSKDIFLPVIKGTVFGPVLGVTFSLIAAGSLDVSVAQTILSLTPASVLLTTMMLHKEKIYYTSFLSILICMIGVFVLVWRQTILTLLFESH